MTQFNDTFLKACRGETVPHIPVWYMRQAGRYQPEYRKIREQYSFFDINKNPEVCADVTQLPVDQLGVDAAILFADIMTPLKPIGVDVNIVEGVGPVIDEPIQSMADIQKLGQLHVQRDLPEIPETVQILTDRLHVPLIGFAGAPFTLSSYLIEGGPSKNYHKTKGFMYAKPAEWFELMDTLADLTITYLKSQVEAGARAIQVFDSWVGALGTDDYEKYIFPTMDKIFTEVKKMNVPTIYFGSGAGHLVKQWADLPADVLSVDWRLSIEQARNLAPNKTIQGNLDPSKLLAPWDMIQDEAKSILDQGVSKPGFIFNLGHGIFPQADVATLQRLTTFVHDYTRKNHGGAE